MYHLGSLQETPVPLSNCYRLSWTAIEVVYPVILQYWIFQQNEVFHDAHYKNSSRSKNLLPYERQHSVINCHRRPYPCYVGVLTQKKTLNTWKYFIMAIFIIAWSAIIICYNYTFIIKYFWYRKMKTYLLWDSKGLLNFAHQQILW